MGATLLYGGQRVPPLCTRNQVSILLLNARRRFLDNFVVLDYGKMRAAISGFSNVSGFQIREPWIASSFNAPTLQQRNEILYCFNRKSVPWFNLDTLAYKRFGTNALARTQAAPERAS